VPVFTGSDSGTGANTAALTQKAVQGSDSGQGVATAARVGEEKVADNAVGFDAAVVITGLPPAPTEVFIPPPLEAGAVEVIPDNEFGLKVYAEMEPVAYADAQNQFSLRTFLSAIGAMFDQGWQLVRDVIIGGKRVPGWSVVVDIDRSPPGALPWLAQFVGVTTDPALNDADQRTRIKETDGWKRGSIGAFKAATKLYLTGYRTVILRERYNSAYHILVITRTYETPDPARSLEAMIAQKPAGLTLEYRVVSGRTYLEVRDENSNYQAAKVNYSSYEMMRATRQADVPPTTPLAPAEDLVPSSTLAPGG
jgi:hypothetical protein